MARGLIGRSGLRPARLCAMLVLEVGLFLTAVTGASAQFDRPWRVYLVPFSHTDVGYTAPVADVIQGHLQTLDSAVAYVQRTRTNAPGTAFRWTIEIPWVLPFYIAQRTPAQVESLMTCVRQGEIDIGAIHFGLQSDLCGNEELVRSLGYAQQLRDRYGVPVRAGMIDDTPGFTWSLAQLLARSNVPYLSVAMNYFLADFYKTTTIPNLFRWKGQDGSTTLVWRSIDSLWAYLEGSASCGVYGTTSDMGTKLTAFLQRLAARGYPYNEVMINCATGDNGPAKDVIVANAIAWNAAHADAKVVIATVTQFFDSIAQAHGGEIPTLSGDAPNWWTWLFAPSAIGGYALSRQAQILLPVAETFSAFAGVVGARDPGPAQVMDDAYVNNLYFEDHNLGAVASSGNVPFWTLKIGWVQAAVDTARSVLRSSVDAIAAHIPTPGNASIAVFNPLAWNRSVPVLLDLADPAVADLGVFDLLDPSTGRGVAVQQLHDNTLAFLAPAVPAVGYRVFQVVPRVGVFASAQLGNSLQLGNEYYAVTIDPATGGIASLIDRAYTREIVNADGQFNQYRFNSTFPPSGMSVTSTDSGAVVQSVTLQGSAQGTNGYGTTVRVWAGLKRVDCLNAYDKLPPTTTEDVDFAFHLSLPSPTLRYEIPFGNVRIFDDELSGFRVNHYAVRHWMDVSAGTGDYTVTLATETVPVVAASSGSFSGAVRMMVSYANSGGAYRAGTGLLKMNFAVSTNSGSEAPDSAMRAGYGFVVPAPVRILPANQAGGLEPEAMSLLSISPPQLLLSTLKPAEDGNGIVVRLFNPLNSTINADLFFSHRITTASECSPGEVTGAGLPASDSHLQASFGPYEVKTLRVVLDGPTGVRGEPRVPSGFALAQNYPNPFNPKTAVSFQLSAVSEVRLVVYDVLGREVATLVNERRPAGRYEVTFDGTGLASGVYFYRLTAGEFTQTRTMVLMK